MDKIISDLESVVTTTGDMLLPVENGAGTFSASIDDVKNYVLSNGATIATKGASILHKQVTCSNGTDTEHDMTSTSGNFQFDDGTGQAILGALTKKIDATWVGGDNQGGMEETLTLTGTYTSSGVTVTGTSSVFTSEFTVGDVIYSTQEGIGRRITVITSDTTLTVSSAWGSNITGEAVKRNGLAPDTTYHYFQTHNPTTDISDFLFSTSVASPTFPSGYTKKKKLVSVLTDGAANIRNGQYNFMRDGSYKFKYGTPLSEYNASIGTTSAFKISLSMPMNVEADLSIFFDSNTSGVETYLLLSPVNNPDITPSASAFNFNSRVQGGSYESRSSGMAQVFMDSLSEMRIRVSHTSSNLIMINNGWFDNNL